METSPKFFVFVLMPFSEKFDDIYNFGIKTACKDTGTYCQRVDEQYFEDNILQQIYNQIAKADLIISDMTGKNANVFYETGYAHALNKQVILLTQNVADIPFDLIQYPHIIYEGKITKLKDELTKRINWFKENPQKSLREIEFNLQIYIGSQLLKQDVENEIRREVSEYYDDKLLEKVSAIKLKIDIHNPTSQLFKSENFRIGIVTSSSVPRSYNTRSISSLPDNRFIHILHETESIFPLGWESLEVMFNHRNFHNDLDHKMIVRVFTKLGTYDFPVKVRKRRN